MSDVQRFDIPSRPTRLEIFRAFREYLEKTTGKKLSPGWYADGPLEKPALHEDVPHLPLERRPPE